MDTETINRLTKHLIRLAAENLTVVQTDPDLAHLAQAGQNPDLSEGALDTLADKARSLSIRGESQATPKHYAAAVLKHALCYRLFHMQGEPHEAYLTLHNYPSVFVIAQDLEAGVSQDVNSPEGRAAIESVKNALTTRCPAFDAAFSNH